MTRSVLAVGTHPGDIEFGCAGTLAAHRAAGDSVTMLVLTCDGLDTERSRQAEAAARELDCLLVWGPQAAERRSGDRRVHTRGHADRRSRHQRPGESWPGLISSAAMTVAAIENVLTGVDADVIYVHAPDDANAEHRAAAVATLSAARHSSRILHYAGESTLQFAPALFVDISPFLDRKLAALAEAPFPVDPELPTGTARHFGAQARVRYAEAFAPARFVWELATVDVALARA
ncbi:PIG-L deacetylase family protein [Actinoplanes sp. NPDC049599]|uniref:PIG-L deacetylase family protein n=1 Tax=Actinoplanes sp. NPDC049599 TaxID=3363903 RepID=UPI0037B8DC77